jgi:thiol-disulfide isomerase/thioredoxin
MQSRRRFLVAACAAALLPACAPDTPARFPALALPALEGEGSLAALSGRPLLVNYWATWCAPCRAEMASLERLSRAVAGRLEVVGVTFDEDLNLAREWLRRERVSFRSFADPGGRISRGALGVTELPQTFLVAADRRVLERTRGAREWDEPRVAQGLLGALAAAS